MIREVSHVCITSVELFVGPGAQVPPGMADWSHSNGQKVAGKKLLFSLSLLFAISNILCVYLFFCLY